MHQICSLLQALLFRIAVFFSLKAKRKSKSKDIKAQLANCMRGHFGWRLCNACTCHFMFPVFSPLSPSSYFLLLHSWFLIPFFKKSINSSRHPWCPLVPISWMCARLYCFFFLFNLFFPSFWWLRHPSVETGTSIRERRSCVPAPFATGAPQYLIRSAFVWRELRLCVWTCD